ncbi:MAG: hypothetical protein AMXMBFR76_08420 [Pseudomonadota bacterium]
MEPRLPPPARRLRDRFVLSVLGLVLFAPGLGLRDPWPPDEPRFAQIAREMLLSGQWLIPHIGGHPYSDKPPVFFWAIAGFEALTGSARLAFLLPSLLAALGTLLLTYDLGRRLWNPRVGLLAALLLAFMVQFTLQARMAQIDALLCFWTTLALYGFLRHLVRGPDLRGFYLGSFAVAAGVLTKGVGFLPLVVLPIAAGWRRRSPAGLHSVPPRHALGGAALVCAVLLAWAGPMLWASLHDPALAAYRDDLLLRQTATRYANAWGHREPFWYYLVQVIPPFWLPGSLLLPWLIPAWRRRIGRGDGRYALLLGYVLVVIVFFSLSSGKRGLYLLPATPAFALACAPLLPGLLRKRPVQALAWGVVVTLGLGLLTGWLYLAWIDERIVPELMARYRVQPWAPLAILTAASLALAAWLGPRRGFRALLGTLLTGWWLHGFWAAPMLDDVRSGRSLMREVRTRLDPGAELGMVDWKEQFLYQADRPIMTFGYRRADRIGEAAEAIAWMRMAPGRWVLLPEERLEPCFESRLAIALGRAHREQWYLVGPEAARDCDSPAP